MNNMTIAYESNTSLAFDTDVFRKAAGEYRDISAELRKMAAKLDGMLTELSQSGWTTPAGSAFQKMADTNWEKNIERYAAMLDNLSDILIRASAEYDDLVNSYINKTQLDYQD